MAVGLHHLSSPGTPQATNHQLTHIGEIEMVLGRDAVEAMLGVQRAEKFAAAGAAALARSRTSSGRVELVGALGVDAHGHSQRGFRPSHPSMDGRA
jgi:hypothetical protein